MSRVCLGELRQHINIGNFDLSVYGYLKIISGKTAALFEASIFAGAVMCGANDADLKKYTRLGRFTGMIFQLTDDCMDYETPERDAKKPVRSDYEQGVITLPLIYALENTAGFKEAAREGKIPKSEVSAVVKSSGGLNFARSVSAKYHEKAMRLIDTLELTDTKRARLLSILDKAYARKE
jgi:heptaprenyl diphosphate synthase